MSAVSTTTSLFDHLWKRNVFPVYSPAGTWPPISPMKYVFTHQQPKHNSACYSCSHASCDRHQLQLRQDPNLRQLQSAHRCRMGVRQITHLNFGTALTPTGGGPNWLWNGNGHHHSTDDGKNSPAEHRMVRGNQSTVPTVTPASLGPQTPQRLQPLRHGGQRKRVGHRRRQPDPYPQERSILFHGGQIPINSS